MPPRAPRPRRPRAAPRHGAVPTLNVPVPVNVRVGVSPDVEVHHEEPHVHHTGPSEVRVRVPSPRIILAQGAPETVHDGRRGEHRDRRGEHGEHAEHREHGEHGEHDLPHGVVDINHPHELPFDPSLLPYAEQQAVMTWRMPARLPLPSKLQGEPLAKRISQGVSEDVRRAEIGYETARALAEKLTAQSRGIIRPLGKDIITFPFKFLRSALSLLFPFRILGPTPITSPFTESSLALKLRARKARADANEAHVTMQRIRALQPAHEERLRALAMQIDAARTPEERIHTYTALGDALKGYQAGYEKAIAGRFKEYNANVLYPWSAPKLLPISDYYKERGRMSGKGERRPEDRESRRLRISPEEAAVARHDEAQRREEARRRAA